MSQSVQQKELSRSLILYYNIVLLSFVGLLTVRHLALVAGRRRRSREEVAAEAEKGAEFGQVKGDWWKQRSEESIAEVEAVRPSHRSSYWTRLEQWSTKPLSKNWSRLRMETPLQVALAVTSLILNTVFVLYGTIVYRGEETAQDNHIHSAALRCGYLSLAQFPLVFALTGRNGVVQFLTGIDYQALRWAHKLLALWMATFAIIHTIDASVVHSKWWGGAGVEQMYMHNYLGQTGIVMMVGLLLIIVFSLRPLRKRFYEAFVVSHVTGAILMLVGLFYHVDAIRAWVWAPIAIWAFERTARLLQLVSLHLLARFNLRSPLIKSTATLVDGAIILRVPYKGTWSSAQHAYLSFPGLALGQSHPFSIANVPSDFNETGIEGEHEMLFIIGVRRGVTATIAAFLEKSSSRSASLMVAVEGPYGPDVHVEQYEDILFVGGGTGITHISSMMADAVLKASQRKSVTTRLKLVWTIQTIGQSSWIIAELLDTVKKAEAAGVAISLDFHITRSPVSSLPSSATSSAAPSRNHSVTDLDAFLPRAPNRQGSVDSMASFASMDSLDSLYHPRINFWAHSRRPSAVCDSHIDLLLDAGASAAVHRGRPRLPATISSFVESAGGSSLVVVCGPPKMAKVVAFGVAKLAIKHPVRLENAVFEC